MGSFQDSLAVKKKIINLFSTATNPVDLASTIGHDELERMLIEISDLAPFKDPFENNALSIFLYAGCVIFDRWFLPSPFVVPTQYKNIFLKFITALRRADHRSPENISTFEIHAIRDDVFQSFDRLPVSSLDLKLLVPFQKNITKVTHPVGHIKLQEFLAQKNELEIILDGLSSRALKTEFKFSVPYVMDKQILQLSFIWKKISCYMEIIPQFRRPEDTFLTASEGQASLPIGASRWQSGISKIHLQLDSLIDGATYTERLQAIHGHEFPHDGWPQSFSIAFEIFHDVAWSLLVKYGENQAWIPAPRDLSNLEFSISTQKSQSSNWINKGSPANLSEIFSISREVKPIELGNVEKLPWFIQCRFRARMYLELGDTNEALFWLNVSVESLFNSRFIEIEEVTGNVGLAESLGSPKEFWAQSEEIVVKQFPEMAGKVKWPSSKIHVSIYSKLKSLYRIVAMRTDNNDLIKHYEIIKGDRNDLFHGNGSLRPSVSTVLAAFDALDWINENMQPLDKVE